MRLPTVIWRLLLRSGSAHCYLELAEEEQEEEEEERRRSGVHHSYKTKTDNPHLTGGEKNNR